MFVRVSSQIESELDIRVPSTFDQSPYIIKSAKRLGILHTQGLDSCFSVSYAIDNAVACAC